MPEVIFMCFLPYMYSLANDRVAEEERFLPTTKAAIIIKADYYNVKLHCPLEVSV